MKVDKYGVILQIFHQQTSELSRKHFSCIHNFIKLYFFPWLTWLAGLQIVQPPRLVVRVNELREKEALRAMGENEAICSSITNVFKSLWHQLWAWENWIGSWTIKHHETFINSSYLPHLVSPYKLAVPWPIWALDLLTHPNPWKTVNSLLIFRNHLDA